jgi:hypothetical protein
MKRELDFDPFAPADASRRRNRRHPIFGPPDCRPLIVPAFGPGRPAGGGGLAEEQFQHNCSSA